MGVGSSGSVDEGVQSPDTEIISVLVHSEVGITLEPLCLEAPPRTASELLKLPAMNAKRFMQELCQDGIEQVCVIVPQGEAITMEQTLERNRLCSVQETALPEDKTRK